MILVPLFDLKFSIELAAEELQIRATQSCHDRPRWKSGNLRYARTCVQPSPAVGALERQNSPPLWAICPIFNQFSAPKGGHLPTVHAISLS